MNNDLYSGNAERTYPGLMGNVPDDAPALVSQEAAAPNLKLFVRGLERDERQLLDGLVRVSQRRSPRLSVLEEFDARAADVLLIGAGDAVAVAWAKTQTWVADKAVIWVGATGSVPAGHISIKRPVQWSILPILLARALESRSATEVADVQVSRGAPIAPISKGLRPQAGTRPILVVDDSLAIRNHLRSLLESGGFEVSEAENVEAALKVIPGKVFDCVLMDVLMPGVDGYEGCRQIKSMLRGKRDLPVVMLTSKSSPFDRIRGKMAGCDAYLTKPVDPKQLGDVLAQQMQF